MVLFANLQFQHNLARTQSIRNPAGGPAIPGVALSGGNLNLKPEEAETGAVRRLADKLMKMAQEQARAMASHDKLDHNVIRDFGERLKVAGYKSTVAAENIGAGYHTLAEAFSGWRDSPPHRANMLLSGATRMGIAAVYSPKSKYKVFWALILAAPEEGRG